MRISATECDVRDFSMEHCVTIRAKKHTPTAVAVVANQSKHVIDSL